MKFSRLASLLYWSVIPAAFIGPGTVTAAAQAGASYRFALLWTFLFSAAACSVLQTAAARTASATGLDLGGAIAARFPGRRGAFLRGFAAWSIVAGCAAYQAGNLIGAAQGIVLATGAPRRVAVAGCALAAGLLLWRGTPGFLARAMGVAVAAMGAMFAAVAIGLRPDPAALLHGAFAPTLPTGAGGLALALVGTTVVPYNLYLGSGLARGRSARDVGFGTAAAVLLGVFVSAAILVAGTALDAPFGDFAPLAASLRARLGPAAEACFGGGLFAAGFTSAITAPLAAATALEGVGGRGSVGGGGRERATRLGVLAVGAAFALSEVKPVPAIIAAQALNGLVLPFAAAFVLVVANDPRLGAARNTRVQNLLGGGVLFVAAALGAGQLAKAAAGAFGVAELAPSALVAAGVIGGAGLVVAAWRAIRAGDAAAAARGAPARDDDAARGAAP